MVAQDDMFRGPCLVDGGCLSLRLSQQVYEKEAVVAAAYRFTAEFEIDIAPTDDGWLEVRLQPKAHKDERELRMIGDEFRNEVLDHQVRLDLVRRYGSLRDMIVDHAFAPLKSKIAR